MNENALLIFTKNAVYSKVKTRLAVTVGNHKALEIYKQLIQHTHTITQKISFNKIVFYADEIAANDIWKEGYQKQLQIGKDLGEKMMHAFDFAFEQHYKNVLIIGTDCPQLDENIINSAFTKLNEYDVVIGPAFDGGYYLSGMKKLHKNLFINIEWSTSDVLPATIQRCKENQLNYFLLNELHDVDEEKDLMYMRHLS